MSVRVISKRAGGTKAVAGEIVVNIARPSILGNPFYMTSESQRDEVVHKYKHWLEQQYQSNSPVRHELRRLAAQVKAGKHLALECWCAPKACHGDVIIEAIEAINKEN